MYVAIKVESRKYEALELEDRLFNIVGDDCYEGMPVDFTRPIYNVVFFDVEVKEKDIDRFMELRQQLETDLHAKVTVYYPGL